MQRRETHLEIERTTFKSKARKAARTRKEATWSHKDQNFKGYPILYALLAMEERIKKGEHLTVERDKQESDTPHHLFLLPKKCVVSMLEKEKKKKKALRMLKERVG